ncbi:Docking protein 3, partial [Merops nubicus]
VLVVRTDAAARCGLRWHYLLSALPQSLTLKDPQSRQPLLTWPYAFLRKFGQDQVAVFPFDAALRSDSGEGTFTFSTPRAPELCRAVASAITFQQQQGKDSLDPRLFSASDSQLSVQGIEAQSWESGAEEPQPSTSLGGVQPASHPPAEPWDAGKPPPEHLYENIFTAELGPAGAEEEEGVEAAAAEEGRWEMGCRQAPEGHSSEAGPPYDNRVALAQLSRGS